MHRIANREQLRIEAQPARSRSHSYRYAIAEISAISGRNVHCDYSGFVQITFICRESCRVVTTQPVGFRIDEERELSNVVVFKISAIRNHRLRMLRFPR